MWIAEGRSGVLGEQFCGHSNDFKQSSRGVCLWRWFFPDQMCLIAKDWNMIEISLRLILYKDYVNAKHAKHQVLLNLSNYEQLISIISLHFQPHFLEIEVFKAIMKKCQHLIVTNFVFKKSWGLSLYRNANNLHQAGLSTLWVLVSEALLWSRLTAVSKELNVFSGSQLSFLLFLISPQACWFRGVQGLQAFLASKRKGSFSTQWVTKVCGCISVLSLATTCNFQH